MNASYTFKPLMSFWYILINNYSLKPRRIVRSLQNFQTWQFTSLSFRQKQRNGLNGTAKSLNCFLTWEEKWSFVVFCWLAKFIAKRACCVVLRMNCWQKWPARLLEVRRRLPVSFFCLFTWNVEVLQTFPFKFVCLLINFDFWAKIFLLENAEFMKRLLLHE